MPKQARTTPSEQSDPGSEKKPVHSIRYGNVKATIWCNEGRNGSFHTVSLVRSWRDDNGDWHDSISFNFKDLPNLAKAINDSHSWIAWQERNKPQNSTTSSNNKGGG